MDARAPVMWTTRGTDRVLCEGGGERMTARLSRRASSIP